MSRSISHPKFKQSSQWLREAPECATALIVAECCIKGQTVPSRRIALSWLTGERSKPAPLREAAAKLPETAALAGSGNAAERKESDGSMSLVSSERCHVRWTVRSIPVPMLICWTGFEDGFNKPLPPITTNAPDQTPSSSKSVEAARPLEVTAIRPDEDANSEWVRPVRTNQTKPLPAAPKAVPVPNEATVNADTQRLPQFAPLDALILNVKKAFSGNCAEADAKFLTDGRMLLLRSACSNEFLAKVKPGEAGAYGPKNPVRECACQKLFDGSVADARHAARTCGYALGASVGMDSEPDQPFVCVAGPGERITIVNGHRLRLVLNITGADLIKTSIDPKSQRIVLFKDEQPLAVLMTVDSPGIEGVFRQMLSTGNNVARLRPDITGVRKAS